jgi:hypothetical protein
MVVLKSSIYLRRTLDESFRGRKRSRLLKNRRDLRATAKHGKPLNIHERGTVEIQYALTKSWMACERKLPCRIKYPQAIVSTWISRFAQKYGLGQIGPSSEILIVSFQPCCSEEENYIKFANLHLSGT